MASIQYVVNAIDNASGTFAKIAGSADTLQSQLDDLNRKFTATVALDGAEKAKFQLGDLGIKLARLNTRVTPQIDSGQITRATIQVAALNLMLDRLTTTRKIGTDGGAGGLRGLLGRLPVAADAKKGITAIPGAGLLGGLAGIPGIGGGIGSLLALGGGGDAAAAGTGVTGLGAAGGITAGILAIPAVLAAVANIGAVVSAGLVTVFGGALTAIGVMAAAKLPAVAKAFSGLGKQASTDLASISSTFGQALKNIALTAQGQLPELMLALGDAFRKIAPAFSTFGVTFVRQLGGAAVTNAIRALGTAFALFLKAFTPQIPGIVSSLANGVTDLAKAFTDHPRMIQLMADVLGWLLKLPGFAFMALAALTNFANWWDVTLPHALRVAFDDATRWVGNIHGILMRFDHETAVIFDGIRHEISTIWDLIWRNTIGRIQKGIADANGFFHRFPGQVIGELTRLGQDLWNLGSWALKKLWDGLKSGAGGIFGWLKGFAGGVVQIFKDVWHWFSPSGVMFQAGRDLMLGLEKGIQSRAHHAQAAFSHAVGNIGSGVQRWAPLVQQALRMEGLSPGLLGNVLFQMQTESGGNPNITNLTDMNAAMGDPSRGLMQTIMSTFTAYHWPGTSNNIFDPLANIAAALNYARHVYGPTLMSGGMGIGSGHGYDQGGWLPTGLSLAYNATGRPERVLGPGEGGSVYVNVHVPPTVNPKDAGRQIAQLILAHTKAGGRLYPAGVTPK